MKDAKIKIVYKKVSDLIQYGLNSKDHPDEQVDAIATSIKLFGFNNPLIIDKENTIIAWHWRLIASKKLWMSEVPCIIADHLSEDEATAYRMVDNRLAEMWRTNYENVKLELSRIDIPFVNEVMWLDLEVEELDLSSIQAVNMWWDDDSEDDDEDWEDLEWIDTRGYSIKYEVVFSNEDQKKRFYDFLKYLESKYDWETIADRLDQHISSFI